jgi:hypothetical protein
VDQHMAMVHWEQHVEETDQCCLFWIISVIGDRLRAAGFQLGNMGDLPS